jgi:FkbM family methyltransferase
MRQILKRSVQAAFEILGYRINRKDLMKVLSDQYDVGRITDWLGFSESKELSDFVLGNYKFSKSQLQQDLVAQWNFRANTSNTQKPFFVEFGATDGLTLSNTYLLEKEFGWDGILCEPGKSWHNRLSENRSSRIDQRCVYSSSGMSVAFMEVVNGELSTISSFAENDSWADARKNSLEYNVATITLQDLLLENSAPRKIDYLSVDTEGSEYEILKKFDFNQWEIEFISVEHNYTSNREKLHRLLTSYGYSRKFTSISNWDDWYFKQH